MSSILRKRLSRLFAIVLITPLATLFVFQSRLIYFPQRSSQRVVESFVSQGGRRLDYQTSQGRQTAWLLPTVSGQKPEHLWIMCAGNASQALSLPWLQKEAGLDDDAFVLIDYPGYGVSEGKPSPATIKENLEKAVPLAASATGFPLSEIGERGISFGHSLGCAATLLGAKAFGIRKVVLLAPFTSTMEMTSVVVHFPLGWLVRHRFDNHARLAEMKNRGGHAWIFHGSNDLTIPASMGRSLAVMLGDAATYREIAGADHNDLFERAEPEIFHAMHEARDWKSPAH